MKLIRNRKNDQKMGKSNRYVVLRKLKLTKKKSIFWRKYMFHRIVMLRSCLWYVRWKTYGESSPKKNTIINTFIEIIYLYPSRYREKKKQINKINKQPNNLLLKYKFNENQLKWDCINNNKMFWGQFVFFFFWGTEINWIE